MRGNTGPSMKMLPKKLARNRVTTKYRPRTDTAICREARETHVNLIVTFPSGQVQRPSSGPMLVYHDEKK